MNVNEQIFKDITFFNNDVSSQKFNFFSSDYNLTKFRLKYISLIHVFINQ